MVVNCIQAAFENGVKHFLFLGSTRIYPRIDTNRKRCLLPNSNVRRISNTTCPKIEREIFWGEIRQRGNLNNFVN